MGHLTDKEAQEMGYPTNKELFIRKLVLNRVRAGGGHWPDITVVKKASEVFDLIKEECKL